MLIFLIVCQNQLHTVAGSCSLLGEGDVTEADCQKIWATNFNFDNFHFTILADADASCDVCGKTENLNLQLFCTSCGRHLHSYCVEMTIPITPVVRMGWQCSHCKVCQGCKQPGDEDKMLCCDHCDKGDEFFK